MKLLLLPSWVSLVRYIEAWQWLWRRRNEVGVIIALCPYLEWAGWNLQAHTLSFSAQDTTLIIGWVHCFNKILIYCFTKILIYCFNKILIGPISFSDSRHKRDYGDIEWEEQTASLIPSVAAGSLFHCPLYWGVKKNSNCKENDKCHNMSLLRLSSRSNANSEWCVNCRLQWIWYWWDELNDRVSP